jgi:hypothetical protein
MLPKWICKQHATILWIWNCSNIECDLVYIIIVIDIYEIAMPIMQDNIDVRPNDFLIPYHIFDIRISSSFELRLET